MWTLEAAIIEIFNVFFFHLNYYLSAVHLVHVLRRERIVFAKNYKKKTNFNLENIGLSFMNVSVYISVIRKCMRSINF